MEIHLIDHPSYQDWVLSPTHPTQGRRFLAASSVLRQLAAEGQLQLREHESVPATRAQLHSVHTGPYVQRVLEDGISGEWSGSQPVLAQIASRFFGGTMMAQRLIAEGAQLVVHLPGAKHHAMSDRSSGFCVFADFAALANALAAEGKRVACLDVDVHHGDGTEALTRDNASVLTFSIHQGGIFPMTGLDREDDREHLVFNRPLQRGDGDAELVVAVQEFIDIAKEFKPDVLLIAAGGDGHVEDPLASLEYSEAGYATAMSLIRHAFSQLPVVMGGAGGYRPDDFTPSMWLHAIVALAGMQEAEIDQLRLLDRVHSSVRLQGHNPAIEETQRD